MKLPSQVYTIIYRYENAYPYFTLKKLCLLTLLYINCKLILYLYFDIIQAIRETHREEQIKINSLLYSPVVGNEG